MSNYFFGYLLLLTFYAKCSLLSPKVNHFDYVPKVDLIKTHYSHGEKYYCDLSKQILFESEFGIADAALAVMTPLVYFLILIVHITSEYIVKFFNILWIFYKTSKMR